VKARSSGDVAAAVNFARDNNLRLVVKGAGHSYQGTSNAPDSLLIWTRAMNKVTLHDAFTPRGCEGTIAPSPAVTAEAGAVWIDLYHAVTSEAGRYVQGGGCADVGVAGLIQSGGFGSFSKGFGAAAAGLLEAEIVTADGAVRIANACTNPDLFWALKGGGGGSWGVVTRVTLRTHDLPAFFGGVWGSIKAQSDDACRRLIARFLSFYVGNLFNQHWGEQIALGPDDTLTLSMVCQGLDNAQARAVWQPLFDWAAASPQDFALSANHGAGALPARRFWDVAGNPFMVADPRAGAPNFHGWWRGDQEQAGMFLHGYESLWLPRNLAARRGAGPPRGRARRRQPPQEGRPAFQQGTGRRAGRSDRRREGYGDQSRDDRGLRARDHRGRGGSALSWPVAARPRCGSGAARCASDRPGRRRTAQDRPGRWLLCV